MIDVGGKDLNFATKNTGGDFDLTQGVLKDVFGKADAPINFIDLESKFTAAQKDLAAMGDSVCEDDKNEVPQAQGTIKNVVSTKTVQDIVTRDFTNISSSTLKTIVKSVQSKVTTATSNVVTTGVAVGAARAEVTGQIDCVSKLMHDVDNGVGVLVAADMKRRISPSCFFASSTALIIQALLIANQNSQNI